MAPSNGGASESKWVRFLAGGTAAGVAEVLTMPIDVAKVRLQVQGSGSNPSRSSSHSVGKRARALLLPKSAGCSALPIIHLTHSTRGPGIDSRLWPRTDAPQRMPEVNRSGYPRLASVMTVRPNTARYNGMVHAMLTIARTEGLEGLFKGLAPALIRQVSYSALTLMSYEPIRNALGDTREENISFARKLMAGGLAGALSVAAVNPTDVIKVRMQADRAGSRYQGTGQAFQHLWKTEGVRGMFVGVGPSVQRAFIVNAAELATYDHAKHLLIRTGYIPDNIVAHASASVIAGLVSAIASNPVDVAKSRIMNQNVGKGGKRMYNGMADCLLKTVKAEGAGALYKGFFPNWMRKGPHVVITFVVYERIRKLLSAS